MDKRKINKILKNMKAVFESQGINIDRLILFGSQAKGRSHAESDLDIIIISDAFEGKSIFERAQMTSQVHWDMVQIYKVPLDLIPMTNNEFDSGNSLIAQCAKENHILYTDTN